MVFRGGVRTMGKLVVTSQRRLRKFISCSSILEPGEYLVVSAAFNHWTSGGQITHYPLWETLDIAIPICSNFEQNDGSIEMGISHRMVIMLNFQKKVRRI